MSSNTFVRIPGQTPQREIWRLRDWLPSLQQAWDALLFRLPDALDPHERGFVTTSMRQGLGLVLVLGLVAGIVPFLANLWSSITVGAAAPLVELGESAAQWLAAYGSLPAVDIAAHTIQSIAGLEPRMPGVLAATLSSLGLWLNTPLNWLSLWIIYGTLVLATARFMGAHATLETFFAATSFAFVPLVLTGLVSLPFVGPILSVVGVVWGFLLYVQTAFWATRLSVARIMLSMLLPIAVLLALPTLAGMLGTLFLRF
ncbi:MAG: hypothetical protein KA259_03325 [Caldilineaceae bacterium]|nr:hypothetical protein [Caldilineaceae bacterium]